MKALLITGILLSFIGGYIFMGTPDYYTGGFFFLIGLFLIVTITAIMVHTKMNISKLKNGLQQYPITNTILLSTLLFAPLLFWIIFGEPRIMLMRDDISGLVGPIGFWKSFNIQIFIYFEYTLFSGIFLYLLLRNWGTGIEKYMNPIREILIKTIIYCLILFIPATLLYIINSDDWQYLTLMIIGIYTFILGCIIHFFTYLKNKKHSTQL